MPKSPNSRRKALKVLLDAPGPLVLPGAYDALSARLVERAGYGATYLGSYAAAASAFGLPDVGLLTLDEIAEQTKRIVDAVDIPVLADAENGFYDFANIWRAVKVFEDTGVAGVHIEDNLGGKHTSTPLGLLPTERMASKIRAAVDARTDPDFIVIARSDAAWVEHDIDGCVRRLEAYAAAGADMVFAPAISAVELRRVRDRIPVPVMVAGDLLDVPGSDEPSSTIAEYGDAGADVVLLWYSVIGAASKNVAAVLDALRGGKEVADVKTLVTDQRAFENSMGYAEYELRSARYATALGTKEPKA
ncbi:oxaloacetate decarboxylase [Arthrobacter sp. Y81]|uniref:isocitrate lyase/PEP mutase family protein n=1 Tax=Arthrobacter sp. Y81 TaxID=2058897 RepID=UPI000CE3DC42|nr:isocitrate lyase/PEP mutase family protein [Arthrobacter sp. Y81]